MKPSRILLVLIPSVFLAAASPDHVALGPLHFGTTETTAAHQVSALEQELRQRGKTTGITAAILRSRFIYTGAKNAAKGKLAEKDEALKIRLDFRCEPKLKVLEIRDVMPHSSGEWDTAIKDVWLQFRDICESKFDRKANTSPEEWPTTDSLPDNGFTVTDRWESEDVLIELGIRSFPTAAAINGASRGVVVLRATNMATK